MSVLLVLFPACFLNANTPLGLILFINFYALTCDLFHCIQYLALVTTTDVPLAELFYEIDSHLTDPNRILINCDRKEAFLLHRKILLPEISREILGKLWTTSCTSWKAPVFLLKYPTKCLSGRPSADLILCRLLEIFVEFVENVMHLKGIEKSLG